MASEPVASACQGLTLEIRRLPKKGVSHRLAPKMVQTWVDLFRNSIQIFSFCSSIEPSSRFFKPFQLPLRTPSLGCASEGGYRFPVLVQGHRAHAAMPRPSRTPKRQQAQSTAVAHRELQKLVDSTAGGADGFDPQADPQGKCEEATPGL